MTLSVMGGEDTSQAPDSHRLFLDMATNLAGSLQQREVIRRILDRALTTLDADRATLSRLVGGQVVIEATAGQSEALTWVGRAYPRETLEQHPAVWQAIHEQRIVLSGRLDDTRAFPEFREALRQVRHLAAIPLVLEDESVGLLVISRREDHPFGEADIPAMNLLAGVAALALRNAVLFHELQTTAAALAAAVAAAQDIASQSEGQDAMGRMLMHAVRAARADEGSMLQVDGDEVVVQRSTGAIPAGARFPMAAITAEALATGEARQLASADYLVQFPQARDTVAAYGRFLVVPMRVAGAASGVVALGRRADIPFEETEMRGVQHIASLAALLLRNAFLLDETKAANRARIEFVNMAVHELRAPLTVLQGYLSMLTAGDVPPDAAQRVLATMGSKTAEMAGAVDEMLSMARLEGHTLPLSVVEVNVAALLAGAAARGESRASLRSGGIEVESAPAVTVLADLAWANRVLDNLVNNALLYCEVAPHVVLSAEVDGGDVHLRVHDNGRGIPDALRERVFERFFRIDTSAVGTGLGLYLSRGLAREMGGSLVLEESRAGAGSVFRLTLPRAGARDSARPRGARSR
jgi:signal transduction histidine kinase